MSALGQKPTFPGIEPMFALHPKADIDWSPDDVRLVPESRSWRPPIGEGSRINRSQHRPQMIGLCCLY